MTFKELQIILNEKLGVTRLADIAREFSVTPQVVSNWKSRNQVPYKYIKILRNIISKVDIQKKQGPFTGTSHDSSINREIVSEEENDDETQFLELILNFFLIIKKNILLFFLPPIIFGLFSFLYFRYYEEPIFKSNCTIIPISSANSGSANSLASQFGINIGSVEELSTMSHASMFPDIIKSRRLARELLYKKFNSIKFGENQDFIRILNHEIISPPKKWPDRLKRKAMNRISQMINISLSNKSPLIIISISSNESELSAQITNAIINTLNNLLDFFKLSQVKEQKLFIENRIKEVQKELIIAEENLKEFRQQNRNITGSPALLLSQERLRRELEVQNQIYYTIKSQYETVQIEEVGKKSMLQVLDTAEPGMKIYPSVYRETLKFTIIGFIFASIILYGLSWYRNNRIIFYNIR